MTSLDQLRDAIPDWAKDLRINLGVLDRPGALSPKQMWGTALACALALREAELVGVIRTLAAEHLDASELDAAASAAAIMAMNNVYYRFTHLVSDRRYQSMPARLRMQILGKPGVAKLDYELWCLAVSSINGCGACMDSHARAVIEGGGSAEMVQEGVRIAAILAGVGVALSSARVLG